MPRPWSRDRWKKCLNFSTCYPICVFNRWIDNVYSFLHTAKHGFLFILKNVVFKEINDIEISITFLNKMFWKNQCLAIFCILGWTVSHEKILIQFKDRRKFSVFVKPEVSSIAHAQLIWQQAARGDLLALVVRVSFWFMDKVYARKLFSLELS